MSNSVGRLRQLLPVASTVPLMVLLLATALLYLPGLTGPFLFDDAPNILDNQALLKPRAGLAEWWSAVYSSGAGALRRPISMLSFALQTTGGSPAAAWPFKVANLALHLLCGVLVFGFAKSLLDAAPAAPWIRRLPLLAAALWLLAPLMVSTVLYPVQRMAQLSCLFSLAGLWQYARLRSQWLERVPAWDEVMACVLWLLLFTLLAAFSKENGVLLPLLVLATEFSIYRGRYAGVDPQRAERRLWLLVGVATTVALVLLASQWHWISGGYRYREFTLGQRLWTEVRLLWEYVGWFAFPRSSALGLFHDDVVIASGWLSPISTLLAFVAWTVVLIKGFLLRGRHPWLLFGALFFLTGHALESTVLALELAFEHRSYLPAVGLAVFLAALLLQLGNWLAEHGGSRLAAVPALLFLGFFALNLVLRTSAWSSEFALAQLSYRHHPASQRSGHFYANALIKEAESAQTPPPMRTQLIALSRHEFEVLHGANPRDLSAAVMLLTLDSQHFPELGDPLRWMPAIKDNLYATRLQATDYGAMRVLMRCVEAGFCHIADEELDALLRVFAETYPYPGPAVELLLWRQEQIGAGSEQRRLVLEEGLTRAPDAIGLYYDLISLWLEQGNYARAHEVIVRLWRVDTAGYQRAALNALFRQAEQS